MRKPPTPSERIRLTISVTADTHDAFHHYAEAAGVSIGRAMGDWLGEQLSAVTFAALRFEEAREEAMEAPRSIARAVPGLAEAEAAAVAPGGRVARLAPAALPAPPRPVIRGGKSPGKTLPTTRPGRT